MRVGIDLDGTLLNYGNHTTELSVNHDFIARLKADGVTEVVIITNQGGLCFHAGNPTKYPSTADFLKRLDVAMTALGNSGIKISEVRVSIFHPKASESKVDTVLAGFDAIMNYRIDVYTIPSYRKPSAGMFLGAKIDRYYGDSDEDEQAAQAAGVDFVRVERFLGVKLC